MSETEYYLSVYGWDKGMPIICGDGEELIITAKVERNGIAAVEVKRDNGQLISKTKIAPTYPVSFELASCRKENK